MMKTFSATLSFACTAFLLFFAPLFRSGKTASALLTMEIIGLLMVAVIIWAGQTEKRLHRPIALFLLLSITLTACYLIPIPLSTWSTLPGRELYTDVFAWLNGNGINLTLRPLSVIPDITVLALLALLPPLGIFLATISLDKVHLNTLVMVFLGVAALESAIGLIQYASNNPDFFFGLAPNGQSAQGTYPNRDHFAALMEMALPTAIALTLYTLGRQSHAHDRQAPETWLRLNQTLVFASLAVLILLGGIFSRSRAGVFLTLVAILLSSFTFARHLGGKQSVGITAALSTIAAGIAISIGLIPVLNRFVVQDPLEDGRWEIFHNAIIGIQRFFPLGSGPGTFPDVYRALQPIDQMSFINHAHNDYLELLFEMGAAGASIIGSFLILYLYGWVKLWNQEWTRTHFIQVAAGIGIFLVLLHSFTDFNFHTPANALFFAFLCGLFFRKAETGHHRHHIPS